MARRVEIVTECEHGWVESHGAHRQLPAADTMSWVGRHHPNTPPTLQAHLASHKPLNHKPNGH